MKPNLWWAVLEEQNMKYVCIHSVNVFTFCALNHFEKYLRKPVESALFYVHKNFICIYENDSVNLLWYFEAWNKSYNKDIKEIIGENDKYFQNFIGDRKIERDIEIQVGVCPIENNWEESIPEYRTQSLEVTAKIDKILRIPDLLFRQIILEMN